MQPYSLQGLRAYTQAFVCICISADVVHSIASVNAEDVLWPLSVEPLTKAVCENITCAIVGTGAVYESSLQTQFRNDCACRMPILCLYTILLVECLVLPKSLHRYLYNMHCNIII
jgi:hypothetical protein